MIGLVGHPNVGKSSMVNYILGRKSVSVKATPGHTKTLQTRSSRTNTRVCATRPAGGVPTHGRLVGGADHRRFSAPARGARALQRDAVAGGGARRDPGGAVARDGRRRGSPRDRALANALATSLAASLRVPACTTFDPEVLELSHEEKNDEKNVNDSYLLGGAVPWSPMSLARAYGKMRGFTRGGATDTHAAGLAILSLVLEGRLPYAVPPPAGAPIVREARRRGRARGGDEGGRGGAARGAARGEGRNGVRRRRRMTCPTPRTCPRTRRTLRRSTPSARSGSTRRARRSTARRTSTRRRALGGSK